ncbi:unnamed protein product [Mytilus edulis]|uniref:Uncharacterized protein n=1 Tax=Mytilus edulis TaxID=6550 RepID=A0A8S3U339_MYTED|nr:unnamed protein product [Mytilus edulis]
MLKLSKISSLSFSGLAFNTIIEPMNFHRRSPANVMWVHNAILNGQCNNRRKMHFKSVKRRSQFGISERTSLDMYKSDTSQCTESFYYFIRGRRSVRKGCNRDSTSIRNRSRFLQYAIAGSQENGGLETSRQPKPSRPLFSEKPLQKGHFDKSP